MDETEFKSPGSVKRNLQEYDNLFRQLTRYMMDTKKPACCSCLKLDFTRGQVKPLDFYKDMDFKADKEPLVTGFTQKRKIKEIYHQYFCPLGHKIHIKTEVPFNESKD